MIYIGRCSRKYVSFIIDVEITTRQLTCAKDLANSVVVAQLALRSSDEVRSAIASVLRPLDLNCCWISCHKEADYRQQGKSSIPSRWVSYLAFPRRDLPSAIFNLSFKVMLERVSKINYKHRGKRD